MKFTNNYGLNLPDLADQYNLEDWNENTNKIDELLKIDEQNLNTHKSDFNNPHQVKGSQLTEPVPTDKIADSAITTDKIANESTTFDKLSKELQDLLLPAGKIEYLSFVPNENWLKTNKRLICDGSAISRTECSRLFNTIGTTFGAGDGSTTFNLPNYIGRLLYGSSTSVTTKGGNKSVTLTTANLPNHTHSMNHTHTGAKTSAKILIIDNNSGQGTQLSTINNMSYEQASVTIPAYSGNTGSSGSGTAVDIMNPYCTAVPVITY